MNYRLIGKIVSTHGIKGELKIKSETDFSTIRYKKGNIVYFKFSDEYLAFTVNSHRIHKKMDLITIDNFNNINDVLKYVGLDVYANVENNNNLAEDEYYYDTLIGLKAYDQDGKLLGEVIDVIEVPQGEILKIRKVNGKNGLIPFVDEFIKTIDIEQQRVIIHLIEGLL